MVLVHKLRIIVEFGPLIFTATFLDSSESTTTLLYFRSRTGDADVKEALHPVPLLLPVISLGRYYSPAAWCHRPTSQHQVLTNSYISR